MFTERYYIYSCTCMYKLYASDEIDLLVFKNEVECFTNYTVFDLFLLRASHVSVYFIEIL